MPHRANGWRLKRTLKRKTEFRPLAEEDFRYLFVTYKDGGLASLGKDFGEPVMEPAEFREALGDEIIENYDGAWTLLAETKRGFMPVGVVLGFFSHRDPAKAPFMIVGDMLWFPWASDRNKVETAVGFFHAVRDEVPFVEYANLETKKFFETIAKHGVMRRVGTTHNVYPGEPTAIFETRRP